ncbi:MAG: AAA family ATPase [Bacteroidales bacterium]|nr:AAA family ATPase [Bacteroidales bacterium]
MLIIKKVILHNFKRFGHLEIDVDPLLNIFIGDNESGKSSILQAIDLVARGSRTRVENIGLDSLFNTDAITAFLDSDRNIAKLPEMYVEFYFNNHLDELLEGENNSLHILCSGIRMRCLFNCEYGKDVVELLKNPNASFPLEFYDIIFDTFAREPYNAYTKKLKSLFIDNSQIGSPHAMREYISNVYQYHLSEIDRINTRHAYRESKKQFQESCLSLYNAAIAPRKFAVRESADDNIETDITITEAEIPLENKGTGTQCFIKTQLSLNRSVNSIDTVLIEEPENHLSYMKTLELIKLIKGVVDRQLFISTHSDLIATRLNLQKCILLNSASLQTVSLASLAEDTSQFFMKAPDNNMLQFVLSNKVILVEGDAEFILMEALYEKTLNKELADDGVGVISVDGKCFKRYLEIAKVLGNRVAVITDNDKDYQEKIINNYSDYTQNQFDNIQFFFDEDNTRYTFEVCMYQDNQAICDEEFDSSRRRISIQAFMLNNKSEAAFFLLKNRKDELIVPEYIKRALQWINA